MAQVVCSIPLPRIVQIKIGMRATVSHVITAGQIGMLAVVDGMTRTFGGTWLTAT